MVPRNTRSALWNQSIKHTLSLSLCYGLPLRRVPWLLPPFEGAKFWFGPPPPPPAPGGPICGLWISAFCTRPVKFANCRSMCSTRIRCSSSGLRAVRVKERRRKEKQDEWEIKLNSNLTFVGRVQPPNHPSNLIKVTIKPCLLSIISLRTASKRQL